MPASHERVLAIDVERHLVRGIVLSNRTRAIAGGYAQLGYPQTKGPAAVAGRIAAALDVKATLPVVVTYADDLPEGTADFVVAHIRAGGFETVKVVPRDVSEQRANPTGGSPAALVDCDIAEGLLTSHAGLTLRDLAPVVGAGLGMLGLGAEPLLIWHGDDDEPGDESRTSFDDGDDTAMPGELAGLTSRLDDDDDDIEDAEIIDAEIVEAPPVAESVVEEPVVAQPEVAQPEVAEPVVEEQVAAAPVAEAPVAEAPGADAPPADDLTVEAMPLDQPAAHEPAAQAPPPSVDEPAAQAPTIDDAQVFDIPASEVAEAGIADVAPDDADAVEPEADVFAVTTDSSDPFAADSSETHTVQAGEQWIAEQPVVAESVDTGEQWVAEQPVAERVAAAAAAAPVAAAMAPTPDHVAVRDPFVADSEPGSRRGLLLLVGLLALAIIAIGLFLFSRGGDDTASAGVDETVTTAAPDESTTDESTTDESTTDESTADQSTADQSTAAESESDAASTETATEPDEADETTAAPAEEPTAEPAAAPAEEPTAEEEEVDPAPEDEPASDSVEDLPPLSSLPERGAVFRPPILYLEGPVPTQEQADELYQRAIEVVGPDNVVNEYVVRPDAPDSTDGNVRVEQAVLFDSASAAISEDFIPTLELGVAVMALNPSVTMVVEGHTDSIGEEESNQLLSEVRAQAVVDYLVSRGIDRDRLTAVGAGESAPVASNETEEGRQINRRIEVNLVDLLSPAGA